MKLKFISIRKVLIEEEKVKHTHRFKDRISVIQQRSGCKMEAHCKDGVRDDGVASLIVAAGERCGLLGVGFENMMRSWVMK